MADTPPLFLLASTSPRRRVLLESLGFSFEVVPNPWDEVPRPRERPAHQARRLSREKAAHFVLSHPSNLLPVLTADTLIDFRGRCLNKPADAAEAWAWYQDLAGRTHRVMTAVTLWVPGRPLLTRLSVTRVSFLRWNEALYRSYLETGQWREVAGGYRIQEGGIRLVDRLQGSWSNVVGLPLAEVYGMISRHLPIPG